MTNTHHAPLIWQHLHAMNLSHTFRTVVTSMEHGQPKPHRTIFEEALGALGTSPAETLYIGDSYVADYLGGPVGLSWAFNPLQGAIPRSLLRYNARFFSV